MTYVEKLDAIHRMPWVRTFKMEARLNVYRSTRDPHALNWSWSAWCVGGNQYAGQLSRPRNDTSSADKLTQMLVDDAYAQLVRKGPK